MAGLKTAITTMPAVKKIYPELLPVIATATNKNTLAQVNFISPKHITYNLKATKKQLAKKLAHLPFPHFFHPMFRIIF